MIYFVTNEQDNFDCLTSGVSKHTCFCRARAKNLGNLPKRLFGLTLVTLSPELREMILKEYIAMKIKEKNEMEWDKVHENILKLPFCQYREQIVPMVICLEYPDCYFEECCFPCFEKEGTVHKATLRKPIIPFVEASPEFKNFLKVCSWDGYNWHE